MLALIIAPLIPAQLRIEDADRAIVKQLIDARFPVSILGTLADRDALTACATTLGIVDPVIACHEPLSEAAAFRAMPRFLDASGRTTYIIVDADSTEAAVRAAGATPIRIGAPGISTIRDAVAQLSAPIIRTALIVRGLVADVGTDS